MIALNHNSISDIRELLEQRGIALKKRFGQNFLVSEGVRRRIGGLIGEELAGLGRRGDGAGNGEVWEVGPGLGALTDELIRLGLTGRLRLFEIDRGIVNFLKDRYNGEILLEEGDFLHTFAALTAAPGFSPPAMVVGNLPYNSAGAIIPAIVESALPVPAMVFLLQQEMVDRLRAEPGVKAYGAVTVLVQSHYRVNQVLSVAPGSFYPVPQVDSSLAVFRQRSDRPAPQAAAVISQVARAAFSQRRKTLRTTLRPYLNELETCGIDSSLRGEVLFPEQYRAIAAEILRRR